MKPNHNHKIKISSNKVIIKKIIVIIITVIVGILIVILVPIMSPASVTNTNFKTD